MGKIAASTKENDSRTMGQITAATLGQTTMIPMGQRALQTTVTTLNTVGRRQLELSHILWGTIWLLEQVTQATTKHTSEVVLTDLGSGCHLDIEYYGKGDAPNWTPVKKSRYKPQRFPLSMVIRSKGAHESNLK
ncbi:hypothetical protein GIB67_022383 [Kingdonia uniflora]|uniref:Uncharacterized protein n=1 Tax=Kingdonia uniflora TaxID=39325 RepID=A0A7J7MTV5_9MAGN|nr:hypothetical protein GIB67_022383 [Kingdonia uniflora]